VIPRTHQSNQNYMKIADSFRYSLYMRDNEKYNNTEIKSEWCTGQLFTAATRHLTPAVLKYKSLIIPKKCSQLLLHNIFVLAIKYKVRALCYPAYTLLTFTADKFKLPSANPNTGFYMIYCTRNVKMTFIPDVIAHDGFIIYVTHKRYIFTYWLYFNVNNLSKYLSSHLQRIYVTLR
jgi:hypothetical protein